MNEFTKEELEFILDNLDPEISIYRTEGNPFNRNIMNKIQSMIANYPANYCQPIVNEECGHKEIVTGGYPRSNPPMKCKKCGEFYR